MSNVLYLTLGYPRLSSTKKIILENQNYDYMILNIPFSDPICEKEEIQKENIIALNNGITVDAIFQMLNEIKDINTSKIILRTYVNIIYAYEIDEFIKRCKEANINRLMIIDLPIEEQEEIKSYVDKYDVQLVQMISTYNKNRVDCILKHANDLVYVQNDRYHKVANYLRENSNLNYIYENKVSYIYKNIF